jgi:hypothetical protein
VQGLVDPTVMIVTMIVPPLFLQERQKAMHRDTPQPSAGAAERIGKAHNDRTRYPR